MKSLRKDGYEVLGNAHVLTITYRKFYHYNISFSTELQQTNEYGHFKHF
jgi:hypothetical protein